MNEPMFQGQPSNLLKHLMAWGQLRKLPGMEHVPKLVDELIGEHGRYFPEFKKLPEQETIPDSQECYWNAYDRYMMSGELRYCEGYVELANCSIPVMHGWCIDEAGRVIDPSVHQDRERMYYGVVFQNEFTEDAWAVLLSHRRIGILGNLSYLEELVPDEKVLIEKFEVQLIAAGG